MHRSIQSLVITGVLSLIAAATVPAQENPFRVEAKAAVLLDVTAEQVLFAQDAATPIPPASLTKIMTEHLAYDAVRAGRVRLEDLVTISRNAWKMGGSQMFLEVNDRVRFGDLLKGLAVTSGNDAALAIAEHLAGPPAAFVALMNKKADELGLKATTFMNPHGLPAPGQQTTAEDMARLAQVFIANHPEALTLSAMKSFKYKGIKQRNRNRLLWRDSRVDGLKTGWFEEAGYHLVATAREGERRLIAVVLGAAGERAREDIALRLLNYGFKNFKAVWFFTAGAVVKTLPVWKGTTNTLRVVAAGPGVVAIPAGNGNTPTLALALPPRVVAPVRKGDQLGEAVISRDGKELRRVPLTSGQDIPQAGFFKRLLHGFLLLFD